MSYLARLTEVAATDKLANLKRYSAKTPDGRKLSVVRLTDLGFLSMKSLPKSFVWPEHWEEDAPLGIIAGNTLRATIVIDPKRMVATQEFVNPLAVTKYLGKKLTERLTLAKAGKFYILQDGHHRIVAEYLKGTKQIQVDLIVPDE